MRDWKSGKTLSTTPLGNEPDSPYTFPYYHIHRADLISVLLNAISNEPLVTLRTNSVVDKILAHDDKVELALDGKAFTADGLIGADGIHSFVRATMFGQSKPDFTGNIAWRALVPTASLPSAVPPVAAAWWGPGKHFVHYYVRGGDWVNCVCVVEKAGWEIESWHERGDLKELKRDFAGWHPTITSLIDNMNPDACYKWALFDRPPMDQWSKGNITLLGDACHPTLPFMAQGAAMAIEDALVLSFCLKRSTSIETAFKHYESLRHERCAGIQASSRRNASVFHLRGLKAWVRNRVMIANPARKIMRDIYQYDVFSHGI
jgi:salicylate hydroxylase